MKKNKKYTRVFYAAAGLVLLVAGLTILPINILNQNYWAAGLGTIMILGGLWALSQTWED